MATIVQRIAKDGTKSWQVTIRIKSYPKVVKTLASRLAALRFAEEIEEKFRSGSLGPEVASNKLTAFEFDKEYLRSAINRYISRPVYKDRWHRVACSVLRNIGDITIGRIDKQWIDWYLDSMRSRHTNQRSPYAWETIIKHLKFIKMVIKWSAGMAGIHPPLFPFDRSILPIDWQNKRTRRLLPHEETALRLVLATAPDSQRRHWIALLELALETGARQSELVMATWDQFSLERKTWTLPAASTKSKVSRAIPLTIKARSIVAELQTLAEVKSDRLFHCFRDSQQVSALFSQYAKKADLRNFRFHDLRHEAVSRLILFKRKLSVYEVMKIVGHSSMEMLNRYANLRTDELADRMD